MNLASLYRRGYISAVAGTGLLVYGIAAGAHLVLLFGVAALALAAFRFSHSRGQLPAAARNQAPRR